MAGLLPLATGGKLFGDLVGLGGGVSSEPNTETTESGKKKKKKHKTKGKNPS